MIEGIDHIALAVRDLDAATRAYETILGRPPDWRGALGGTHHAWFQLPGMALDIIAASGDGAAAAKFRSDLDKYGEGIFGLGFSVRDLDSVCAKLERRAVETLAPAVTRSQNEAGEVRAWRIALARRAGTHGPALFFVEKAATAWPVSPAKDETSCVLGLDHIVIHTTHPNRAAALYGARLGLDLRLDRSNAQWGSRLMFFRCGESIVEVGADLKVEPSDAPDRFGGLAWRVQDAGAVHARLAAQGIELSDLRQGRKPGTHVFTLRGGTCGVPTLMISA